MAKWRIIYKTDGGDGFGQAFTNTDADSAGKVREEVANGDGDVYVPSKRIVCIHQHGG